MVSIIEIIIKQFNDNIINILTVLVSALAHVVASSLARGLSQLDASDPQTLAAHFVPKRITYMSFFQTCLGQSAQKDSHH